MIYILHFDPPYRHAGHYVGFTKDDDVGRRVEEHLTQSGRRPSPLVGAALAAGCTVVLAGTLEGDRTQERILKKRKNASSFCPRCRAAYNERAKERMRQKRRKEA